MSWNRIVLPLKGETCPDTIEIGQLGWEVYRQEKELALLSKPEVSTGTVASSLCENIGEKYPLEPCKAPARDEPNIAFVFGDPRMMGQLRDSVDTDCQVVT